MARFLKVRSKNHTAEGLRKQVLTRVPAVLRLGSITPTNVVFPKLREENVLQINTVDACKTSGNKILMKDAFTKADIITAEWDVYHSNKIPRFYPSIIKHIHSSQGNGIYMIHTEDDFKKFVNEGHQNGKYVVEKYYSYTREYRLHVTKDGCFYTCRKMLKNDAEERWHRHDNNSVWILENNPLFDKPINWKDIEKECVKAMKACGLDICAIDIKVQSAKHAEPKFIILETNSAPSLGEITTIKYIEQLKKMLPQ